MAFKMNGGGDSQATRVNRIKAKVGTFRLFPVFEQFGLEQPWIVEYSHGMFIKGRKTPPGFSCPVKHGKVGAVCPSCDFNNETGAQLQTLEDAGISKALLQGAMDRNKSFKSKWNAHTPVVYRENNEFGIRAMSWPLVDKIAEAAWDFYKQEAVAMGLQTPSRDEAMDKLLDKNTGRDIHISKASATEWIVAIGETRPLFDSPDCPAARAARAWYSTLTKENIDTTFCYFLKQDKMQERFEEWKRLSGIEAALSELNDFSSGRTTRASSVRTQAPSEAVLRSTWYETPPTSDDPDFDDIPF